MTYGYARGRHFLPVLSPMDRELHPLMAWWAVLYTLSILARYQPAAGVKLISLDDSHHAAPIERLLERCGSSPVDTEPRPRIRRRYVGARQCAICCRAVAGRAIMGA
ncbi:precorrin-6Y C5,15-methyltransferase [Streptomyces lydicamycinicus]|uniref:Precorrin-6Y C5,15-methyltransferase n=1 Tax=Streptomyces lydicamycinicus TaxID=1546107 RepID=A0A0P4RFQ2_9ACTN|nr:precorrin-6Y C5,15-methyltransferase [Streptomyces lydicamycinicus]